MSLTKEQYNAIQGQLRNPQHCFIRIGDGFMLHGKGDPRDDDYPFRLAGQPVRFTRLAAERIAEDMRCYSTTVELVPEGDVPPVLWGQPLAPQKK